MFGPYGEKRPSGRGSERVARSSAGYRQGMRPASTRQVAWGQEEWEGARGRDDAGTTAGDRPASSGGPLGYLPGLAEYKRTA